MRKKEVSYSKKTIVRLIWTGILVAGVIILTMGAVCFAGRLSMKVKVGLLVFDCILFVVYFAEVYRDMYRPWCEGILDALKELAPNANVEVTAKAGYTPEGVDVGDAWVQSNKDLNVVVGINDAGVLGVYESFKSAGIKNDKLGMFGGDAVDDALAAIEEGGAFKATVSTNMLKNANYFIDMAVELAKNGKLEEREKLFPLEGITADNVAEYKKSIEE